MKTPSEFPLSSRQRWASILVIVSILVNVGGWAFVYTNQQRIGFVRSSELVDGYLGMKEARNQYTNKSQKWQANVDTLERDFKKTLHQFQFESSHLSASEKLRKEAVLKKMQENLYQYTSTVRENAQAEDEKMTQGVLNQINSFVQEYGKSKGFDVILGTTLSGNILYGEEQLDITRELLRELNRSYRPSGVASVLPKTSDNERHAN